MDIRQQLTHKKRIVIKIGSSSLAHPETGRLDLRKVEKLIRILCDLRNQDKDVVLVSSGAIAVGRQATGIKEKATTTAQKQALAAVGQARLMMTYQRLFAEYNHLTAQILMTKDTIVNARNCVNARNTFEELFQMGIIPVVNENDTVATHEIEFGDNDRLSAIVAVLVHADLLILLSDIDGMYTDDPNRNPQAKFIDLVERIDENLLNMAKESSGSDVGTGGMSTKLTAARIATDSGVDMVIANGDDVDNIHRIMDGEQVGTLFMNHKNDNFDFWEIVAGF